MCIWAWDYRWIVNEHCIYWGQSRFSYPCCSQWVSSNEKSLSLAQRLVRWTRTWVLRWQHGCPHTYRHVYSCQMYLFVSCLLPSILFPKGKQLQFALRRAAPGADENFPRTVCTWNPLYELYCNPAVVWTGWLVSFLFEKWLESSVYLWVSLCLCGLLLLWTPKE